MKECFTFDDVLILPKYSEIGSRIDLDLSQEFLGLRLALPIISANMDFITEFRMAIAMIKNGGFYILHRFMPDDTLIKLIADLSMFNDEEHRFPLSFSIGTRDVEIEYNKIIRASWFSKELFVTVDVAHGHHSKVIDMIKRLKDDGVKVIAGNVATNQGFFDLATAGADAIKVGIGPGAVCTTRDVTGIGVPQLTAIIDCADAKTMFPNVKLIADGGIKSSGDIVKALAAGADMVMLGSLLAGTDETPGEVRVGPDNRRWRPYRGQSIFGVNENKYTPEGVSGWVESKGPVADVLKRLAGGIRSGMSYVGANNLTELRSNAEFIRVSPGTQLESRTRVELLPPLRES